MPRWALQNVRSMRGLHWAARMHCSVAQGFTGVLLTGKYSLWDCLFLVHSLCQCSTLTADTVLSILFSLCLPWSSLGTAEQRAGSLALTCSSTWRMPAYGPVDGFYGSTAAIYASAGVDDADSYDELCTFVQTVSQQSGVRHFVIHSRKCLLRGLSPAQNRTVPKLK